ncbi:MAG TPA: hypothetical protein VEC19_01010 [Usitatibacter sp.]|nr:hypothetical protein [Usitatibacter sp.]
MRIPLLAALATIVSCLAMPSLANEAARLKAAHDELRAKLAQNPFGRPLTIDSREAGSSLEGDVHAILEHPYTKVRDALSSPRDWCELLTLPFNVQKCEARENGVSVFIGRKPDTPIEDATRLDLRFAVPTRSDDFLEVRLGAPQGPAGTRDYRMALSAAPLDAQRTFVRFRYGYTQGTLSNLALQAYLSTSGADKVGFSSDGQDENGKPRLVGGVRGILERNTMRYFLAIDAYLDTVAEPEASRKRARLERWFRAVDRYPRQLREMTLERYLQIKLG